MNIDDINLVLAAFLWLFVIAGAVLFFWGFIVLMLEIITRVN